MKLRKTLSVIMAASLAMFSMVGCSQSTINYSKEISNTSKWEATTSNMQGTINVEALGQNINLNFTSEGYSVGGDKAYVDMKLNDPTGKISIPEIKVYVDGGVSYINKSYYESVYTLSGQTVPAGLANLNAEYIAVDSGIDINSIKALFSQPDAFIQLGKMVFGNSDIDLPYVQNGREYSLKLDSNQTVDLVGKAAKSAVNNLDNINSNFKLGLTNDNIKQVKDAINDQSFESGLTQAKTLLEGSVISAKEVFTDNDYKQDLNISLLIKDLGKMSIQVNSTSVKSEVKAIDIPTNTVKLTQEQLTNLLIQEGEDGTTYQNQQSGVSSSVIKPVK